LEAALRMGRRGDLVLVFGDQISRCWKQIVQFKEDAPAEQPSRVEESLSMDRMPVVDDAFLSMSHELEWIVDERGVRLAQELSD